MGFKDILNRIKKLEEGTSTTDTVTLICIEQGKECRKCVNTIEAANMVLQQETAKMFGTDNVLDYIITGVESGDEDGFIAALLTSEDIDPEEIKNMIEV